MQSKETRGFTLIELLVVIAIIGILSSIVLVALRGARDKARDARVVADLAQLRSVAEYLYDGDYDAFIVTNNDVEPLYTDIEENKPTAGKSLTINRDPGTSSNKYCAYASLNIGSQFYCIDSSGIAGFTATDPTTNFTCPPDTSG